jgi:anthranilate synthase/aminodeoxychorismate synthase-like glutamine amidotransferase
VSARLLLVDNRDSFTYNVAQLFGALGADVRVVRSDDDALDGAAVAGADALVIGPGPGRPDGAARTLAAIGWALAANRPLFGVCLGAQAIGAFFGGRVEHAPSLVHGKASPIAHDGSGVLAGVPSPFAATRYHSLCLQARSLPAVLRANATSDDGVIQGIAHRTLPVHGVQFHPESVLTAEGARIFGNFLAMVAR